MVGLGKGVRYQDNFSFSFTQTFVEYRQKSDYKLIMRMSGRAAGLPFRERNVGILFFCRGTYTCPVNHLLHSIEVCLIIGNYGDLCQTTYNKYTFCRKGSRCFVSGWIRKAAVIFRSAGLNGIYRKDVLPL